MTQTEKQMIEKVSRKGYATFVGVRAYSVLKRVEANYQNLTFQFSISHRAFGKSDWDLGTHGRREACYEVSVRAK